MAHIPDGVLSAPVLIGGGVIAIGGVALGLSRISDRLVPRIAVMSAAFFAGSLISVPIGPSSIHLLLAGLMGIMLGFGAFLAVLVALMLQMLLFGFGGLTTLGINIVNIALPGVAFAIALGPIIRKTRNPLTRTILAATLGGLSVVGTAGLVALSLWLSSSDYVPVASVMIAVYLPLALSEALVTACVVGFLARVQPEALRPVAI